MQAFEPVHDEQIRKAKSTNILRSFPYKCIYYHLNTQQYMTIMVSNVYLCIPHSNTVFVNSRLKWVFSSSFSFRKSTIAMYLYPNDTRNAEWVTELLREFSLVKRNTSLIIVFFDDALLKPNVLFISNEFVKRLFAITFFLCYFLAKTYTICVKVFLRTQKRNISWIR